MQWIERKNWILAACAAFDFSLSHIKCMHLHFTLSDIHIFKCKIFFWEGQKAHLMLVNYYVPLSFIQWGDFKALPNEQVHSRNFLKRQKNEFETNPRAQNSSRSSALHPWRHGPARSSGDIYIWVLRWDCSRQLLDSWLYEEEGWFLRWHLLKTIGLHINC